MSQRPLISYGYSNEGGKATGCFLKQHAGDWHDLEMNPENPGGNFNVKPFHMWAWVPPPSCPFRSIGPCRNPFRDNCTLDVENVCHIFRGRDLLIVGDSTQYTMHNLILASLFGKDQPFYHPQMDQCPDHVVPCKVPFRVRYVRNDWLVYRSDDMNRARATFNTFAYPWMHHVNNNTILYLNRGSHYEPDTSKFLATLVDTFKAIAERAPEAMIVYRNTPVPMDDLLETKLPRSKHPVFMLGRPEWGWLEIQRQNLHVRDLIYGQFPNVIFNDVHHMSAYRTDGHIDPVHMCHPGIPDFHWVLLLDSIIVADESGEWA